MDETTKQCTLEVRKPIRASRGQSERYDGEYERNGVAHLMLFYTPLEGRRTVRIADNHAGCEWAEGVRYLVKNQYPKAKKITLVMDNLSTHCGASLYKTFEPKLAHALLQKLEFVFTPKHGSWLNMAECEFRVLERDGSVHLRTTGENSPDLYPQVAVTQYLPNGSRSSLYSERGLNVYEGATPPAVGELFELGRKTWDEVREGWRETFESSPEHAQWEILEGALEVGREVVEGLVQVTDDLLVGGELEEGASEVCREWDEGWREVSDANGVIDTTGEVIEATAETGYEFSEAIVQTVDHVLIDGEIQELADESRREFDEARREIRDADGIGKIGEFAEGGLEVTGQVVEGLADVMTFGVFSN